MSPARGSRREAAAGDGPPLVKKNGSGSPSPLPVGGTEPWGACLGGCIGSFREKVARTCTRHLFRVLITASLKRAVGMVFQRVAVLVLQRLDSAAANVPRFAASVRK